ncbi:uncharacterized protein LOC121386695 [Gigantopelta aegis]|uniref:uncharacterized protein LOC121386695 n=1 Tax=Gigantopelta aegis TaxID=1735272 RepID=UPI001B88D40F|nr:uncharacterized protein LOC121386695 [Gigantopelta aegis]
MYTYLQKSLATRLFGYMCLITVISANACHRGYMFKKEFHDKKPDKVPIAVRSGVTQAECMTTCYQSIQNGTDCVAFFYNVVSKSCLTYSRSNNCVPFPEDLGSSGFVLDINLPTLLPECLPSSVLEINTRQNPVLDSEP